MVGHGTDKADRTRRARKAPVARRARAGRGIGGVKRLKLAQASRDGTSIDTRPQLAARHGIARVPQLGIERGRMRVHSTVRARVFVADGHVFDKSQVNGAVDGQTREGCHVLVEPTYHDAVNLNGLKAPGQRRIDAGHGLLEPTQACDLSKQRGVERIERNVDTVEPRVFELRRQLGQQGAIGGERDVLDLRDCTDVANERDDATADQRLATRQTHAANALPRHQAHKAGDFLGAEQLGVRTRRHAVGGHAVDATEIALVSNGDAQVVDVTAKTVMLHALVHAALPSRGDLFFGEYSTAHGNRADTRTTGQAIRARRASRAHPQHSNRPNIRCFSRYWQKTSNVGTV